MSNAKTTLTRDELLPLERYHASRAEFRQRILQHKAARQVCLGAHATLYFEDKLTIQYQVQEMLRVERIFEPEAIQAELDAYTPLIPDGDNWKATFMLEYAEVEERRVALAQLVGIEHELWVQVGGAARVKGIADEDMERTREAKTSAVHFVRFQLTPDMVAAARAGAPVSIGVAHQLYTYSLDPVPETVRASLVHDLA
jgi:hypothetical protein